MLRIIERATNQRIEEMQLPSVADVNEQRVAKFKERIAGAALSEERGIFLPLIEQIESEQNISAREIAAGLAALLQGPSPFLLTAKADEPAKAPRADSRPKGPRSDAEPKGSRPESHSRGPRSEPPRETFRIEVGHTHGVQPGNIVGAIANEAGLDGRLIGQIDIHEDHSFVDLPVGMPKEIFKELQSVRVLGAELRISRVDGKPARAARPDRSERPPRPAAGADRPPHAAHDRGKRSRAAPRQHR